MTNTHLIFPNCVLRWAKYHKTVEIIDKTKFYFPLISGAISVPTQEFKPEQPFEDWDCITLVEWLSTLKLKELEQYKTRILNDKMDGDVIKILVEEDSWATHNFTLQAADKIKITSSIKKWLKST